MFSLDPSFNTLRYKTNFPNNKDTHGPHLKPKTTIDVNRLKKSNADESSHVMCRQSREPEGYILIPQVNLTPFAVVSNFKPSTLIRSLEPRNHRGVQRSSGALALTSSLSGAWLRGSLLSSLHIPHHIKVFFTPGNNNRFVSPGPGTCPPWGYPVQGYLVPVLGASNLLLDCWALPPTVETEAVWNPPLNICYIVSGVQSFILLL